MAKRNFKAALAVEKRNHPERGEERASRNRARLIVKKRVGATAVKGKEIEHKDGNALNNDPANLKIVTKKANNRGRRGGPAKGG